MIKRVLALTPLLLFVVAQLFAQQNRKEVFNLEGGLAIQGYDPVAYFASSKAIEGKRELAYEYSGVTYRFATIKNRDLFKANSEKYEPQYGGWCAYAMGSTGEKVEVDPETFKIIDGKLYLFYNAYFNNTLKKWNTDQSNLKKMAEINWNKLNK